MCGFRKYRVIVKEIRTNPPPRENSVAASLLASRRPDTVRYYAFPRYKMPKGFTWGMSYEIFGRWRDVIHVIDDNNEIQNIWCKDVFVVPDDIIDSDTGN